MIRRVIPYIFWTYTVTMLIATVIPGWSTHTRIGVGIVTFRLDYWLHFFSNFGLTVLFILLQFCQLTSQNKHEAFYKSFWIFLFGFFTETMQLFVPGRSFSLKDMIADALGVFFAIVLCYLFRNLIYKIVHFELKPYILRNFPEYK